MALKKSQNMKPYKAVPPYRTINKIRSILEFLNIFTTEFHVGMENFYHSCRVSINNEKLQQLNLGTNGKGIKVDYALASAYGELMERIQNRMIFKDMFYASIEGMKRLEKQYPGFYEEIKRNNCLLQFRYYPDETILNINSWLNFEHLINKFLPNLNKDLESNFFQNERSKKIDFNLLQAPYYNVKENKVENIPFQLLRLSAGSTGLCAGNTPEEAILQGINEIFERFVLQQIYIQELVPPTIPESFFQNNEIIHKLKHQKKFSFEIKDCSLGCGFPVIGLLLIDIENNSYSFRLGADANPDIALQRCYTEMFQGVNQNRHLFNKFNWNQNTIDFKEEYNKNVINGTGHFPESIFKNEFSYEFKGLVQMNKESDQEELKNIINFLLNKGYTIYVRDNSFLKFPAYHLYIPGLSEVDSRLYSLCQIYHRLYDRDFTYQIPPEYHIKDLEEKGFESLYCFLKNHKSNIINLTPYCTHKHNFINKKILLSLVSFRLSNNLNAFNYMDSYIADCEKKSIKIERYYYALRDFLYWSSKYDSNIDKIKATLSHIYNDKLIEEVASDMKDKNTLFKYFKFPNCFNCSNCEVKKQCQYFAVLELDAKIQQQFKENLPEQSSLSKIFLT